MSSRADVRSMPTVFSAARGLKTGVNLGLSLVLTEDGGRRTHHQDCQNRSEAASPQMRRALGISLGARGLKSAQDVFWAAIRHRPPLLNCFFARKCLKKLGNRLTWRHMRGHPSSA